MSNNPSREQVQPALFIGIDWADQEHDVHTIDSRGAERPERLQQNSQAIETWITKQLQQAGGRPIAIMLEQSRGPLVHALMFRENVILYPINPKQLARYRESYSNAGCKDDLTDAKLLARMLRERYTMLKAWQPDDEATRLLARLCQTRRQVVDERTRLQLQLLEHLKAHNPLVLELSGTRSITPLGLELLRRWPNPQQLKRTDRRWLHRVLKDHGYRKQEQRDEIIQRIRAEKLLCTDRALLEPLAIQVQTLAKQIPLLDKAIEELEKQIDQEMNTHPDAHLFQPLPGAGKAMAPRLLAAFGSQRDRYANAEEISNLAGIAPVTKQSGKSRIVHRRFACPKYLRQTFHEYADHARKWCPWSKAYYNWQRSRGMKHHAALRKLASRWIRILYRVWKSRTPYDPDQYIETIKRKNPDIVPFLSPNEN